MITCEDIRNMCLDRLEYNKHHERSNVGVSNLAYTNILSYVSAVEDNVAYLLESDKVNRIKEQILDAMSVDYPSNINIRNTDFRAFLELNNAYTDIYYCICSDKVVTVCGEKVDAI